MHEARTMIGVLLALALVCPGRAAVELNGMFGDNMVLQRDAEVPIWGTAAAGERIIVRVPGQRATTVAADDGRWMIRLDPIEADGPFEVRVDGENRIELSNVLLGDVWICSGQSNMVWPVNRSRNAESEIASADSPLIRLCQIRRATAEEPLRDVAATWSICSPETVGGFSAVAYFFGRAIHEATGVPIGLVSTNWGGTPVEAWMSTEALEALDVGRAILASWDERLAAYPAALEKYQNETLRAWEAKVAEAREAGQTPPARPRAPAGPTSPVRPGNLFNAMVHPIIPFAMTGAIWYQGEANAHDRVNGAWAYRTLFPAMIRDWRKRWGQGDFPFAWVSLANFRAVPEEPGDSAWAELREAQTKALSLPNTGQALAIDVGEADNIHPRDKQTVGRRLALWALATVYEQDCVWQGPSFREMKIERRRIRLSVDHVDGGLRRGVTTNAPYPSPLLGFQIAGANRRWVWADARIEGDTVVVWSDEVDEPVAVRYAWADNPACNLYNDAGLPAVPFRTDDWPLSSQPTE